MRNTQCITKCYLGYLCYSHEVEKTERLRVCKAILMIANLFYIIKGIT